MTPVEAVKMMEVVFVFVSNGPYYYAF